MCRLENLYPSGIEKHTSRRGFKKFEDALLGNLKWGMSIAIYVSSYLSYL